MSSIGASSTNRMLLGFAVLPFIAAVIIILVLLVSYGPAPAENIAGAVMIFAADGYACELSLALLLYLLFKRKGLLHVWHFLALGCISGGLTALPEALLMFPARGVSVAEGFSRLLIQLVPFGAILGLALWWFAWRRYGT